MVAPDAVRALFADATAHAQAAWSLLFYALWHSHHICGVPCDGGISDVLAEFSKRRAPAFA